MAFLALAGATALATDVGLLQWQKRRLQAAVDAAALAAARAPAGRDALARAALDGNGFAAARVTAVAGTYADDPALGIPARFTPGGTSLTASPAVQVTADADIGTGLLGLFTGTAATRVAASAIAAHQPLGAFSVGSGTAAIDEGLVNVLLSGLLGGSISLTAADYSALLNTQVAALRLLDAFATAGTYDQLLNTTVNAGTLLTAAASALTPGGSSLLAQSALLGIAARAASDRALVLGDLLALGARGQRPVGSLGDAASYATLGLNAYDLLMAAAALGGRNRVVALNTGLDVRGAQVSLSLMLIEPPAASGPVAADGHVALGPVGTRAHTAQARLLLDIRLLGLGGLLPYVVHVPILVEAALATATLSGITCDSRPATDTAMTIAVTTGVGRVALGTVPAAAFAAAGSALVPTPAALADISPLGIGLVTITASASVPIGSGSGSLTFSASEVRAGTVKRVSTTGYNSHLLTGLIGNITFGATVLGLPINLTLISGTLNTLTNGLNVVLDRLDPVLINLLNTLGVTLGYADVRPSAARCGQVALVR
jgi:uncharacterized membrane protein